MASLENSISTGEIKNPFSPSGAALPNAAFPSAPSLATPSRTSASCAPVASGPMRASSSAGLPTRTAFRPSARSSRTVAAWAAGTSTRRIAVHFWPAFCVMSRSTSFRKVSYMSPPGSASGPSTAAFKLSASTLTRAEARHADVLAVKARRAAELHAFPVGEDFRGPERSADLGVGLEREDRAVDVELRVRARVAAVRDREVEQLVPVGLDCFRHLLEERAALCEGKRAQRRSALAASVGQR